MGAAVCWEMNTLEYPRSTAASWVGGMGVGGCRARPAWIVRSGLFGVFFFPEGKRNSRCQESQEEADLRAEGGLGEQAWGPCSSSSCTLPPASSGWRGRQQTSASESRARGRLGASESNHSSSRALCFPGRRSRSSWDRLFNTFLYHSTAQI